MEPITVRAIVNAPIDIVWNRWTLPEHITRWAFASDDWNAPRATNDLRTGGSFSTRMEAKDGSMGFDFGGIYDTVESPSLISYTLGDGRKVITRFEAEDDTTKVTQTFDPETENPAEMQEAGWQMILDNFKRYAES